MQFHFDGQTLTVTAVRQPNDKAKHQVGYDKCKDLMRKFGAGDHTAISSVDCTSSKGFDVTYPMAGQFLEAFKLAIQGTEFAPIVLPPPTEAMTTT